MNGLECFDDSLVNVSKEKRILCCKHAIDSLATLLRHGGLDKLSGNADFPDDDLERIVYEALDRIDTVYGIDVQELSYCSELNLQGLGEYHKKYKRAYDFLIEGEEKGDGQEE